MGHVRSASAECRSRHSGIPRQRARARGRPRPSRGAALASRDQHAEAAGSSRRGPGTLRLGPRRLVAPLPERPRPNARPTNKVNGADSGRGAVTACLCGMEARIARAGTQGDSQSPGCDVGCWRPRPVGVGSDVRALPQVLGGASATSPPRSIPDARPAARAQSASRPRSARTAAAGGSRPTSR